MIDLNLSDEAAVAAFCEGLRVSLSKALERNEPIECYVRSYFKEVFDHALYGYAPVDAIHNGTRIVVEIGEPALATRRAKEARK